MKKILVSIIVVMVTLIALLPTIAIAAQDTSSGQFTAANKVPAVGSITSDNMTPQTNESVTVPVTDNNKLKQLDMVLIKLFYDAAGDPDLPAQADPQDAAIIKCSVGGASGTWSIITSGSVILAKTTISFTSGSTAVTGTGTAFDTELEVGSILTKTDGTVLGEVASPPTATALTLTAGATSAYSGDTYRAGTFLTGTISTISSNTAVTGSGAAFLTQLVVGGILTKADGTVLGEIESITNNDSLTLTAGGASATYTNDRYMTAGTWKLLSCTQPSLQNSSGDFVFAFQPGKTARKATSRWFVSATAIDNPGGSDTKTQIAANGKTMDAFGEVRVVSTSVTWTSADPGSGFADDINEKAGLDVTYISNGDYTQSVSATNWFDTAASTTLTGAEPTSETVIAVAIATGFDVGQKIIVTDTDGAPFEDHVCTITAISGSDLTITPGLGEDYDAGDTVKHVAVFIESDPGATANEFSLMATEDTTYDDFVDAVQVTVAGAVIDNSGVITEESGEQETNNALWLGLSNDFDAATYQGTITYIITNS